MRIEYGIANSKGTMTESETHLLQRDDEKKKEMALFGTGHKYQ